MHTATRHLEVLHPYLGYVLDPDAGTSLTFGIDQWGFESAEDHFAQASARRCGIFGGSVAKGVGHWWAKESLLAAPRDGNDIVLTYALNGYKQPQQAFALAYLCMNMKPLDVVVNIDGFNEVALHSIDNEPHGTCAAYPRNWARRLRGFSRPEDQVAAVRFMACVQDSERLKQVLSTIPTFLTFPLRIYLRRKLASILSERRRLNFLLRYASAGNPTFETTGALDPVEDRCETLARIWYQSSLFMHRLCLAHGLEYVHILQPNQYVPNSKPFSAMERRFAYDESHPCKESVERGYPLLQRYGQSLRQIGVNFQDFSQVFASEERDIYVDSLCHLNDLGNQILAGVLRECIGRVS